MFKKTTPPWSFVQTKAVQALKTLCKKLPPFHIPSTSYNILQTDASDEF
jgi:hypothetical protein